MIKIASNPEFVPNSFFRDGSPGKQEQWVQNQLVRLTWQASPRNKVTVYHDRYPKFKSYELAALYEPETAAYRRDPNQALYVHCKSGVRSLKAINFLKEQGFKYAKSVKGGISAWSDEIDHTVPKY